MSLWAAAAWKYVHCLWCPRNLSSLYIKNEGMVSIKYTTWRARSLWVSPYMPLSPRSSISGYCIYGIFNRAESINPAHPTARVKEMLKELASFLRRSDSTGNLVSSEYPRERDRKKLQMLLASLLCNLLLMQGQFVLVSDSMTDGGFLIHHYITQALQGKKE